MYRMFPRIRSFFSRWHGKLSSKIFVKLLVLLLTSNLILLVVIYQLIGNLIAQKEAETLSTIQSLEHALGRELGDLFNLVTTLTNQLIIEPDLQQILIDSFLEEETVPMLGDSEAELRRLQKQYDNEAVMLSLLSKYRVVWNNVYSLAVVDAKKNVYLSTAQNYQIYPGDIRYSRLMSLQTKENMFWSIDDSLTKSEDMITIVRKIYGTTMPKEVIGYVVINMSLDEIRDSFDTYKYFGNMLFGLYDSTGLGRMVYDGSEISADDNIPLALSSASPSQRWSTIDYHNQSWKMIKGVVDHAHLTGNRNYLFVGLEEEYLQTMRNEIRDRLLYGYLLFLLLSLAVSFYGARVISGRIGTVLKTMRRFGNHNLRTRIRLKGNDEISVIGHTFNVMADRIEDLLENLENEQKMKRMFELRVMEYQINPHFLYNTLDTVHWLALESNQQQISRMVDGLSKLFRIILSKGKERIAMREEFEMIRIYLDIHKIRLGDRFDYNIQLDSDAADYTIGKLVLQPIVENAIMHGIRKLRGKGLISISGIKRGKYIELTVRDNGVGMDRETLEKQVALLNSRLLDERIMDSFGYGMKNVDTRMKMMFGDRYRMEVHSEGPLSGCKVSIYLQVED